MKRHPESHRLAEGRDIVALAALIGLLAWPAIGAKAPERPNVILVVLDTVRADRLSAYGYSRPTSPALVQLAAEGTLYEQAIAPAPWTLPSHASLFTGLPVREHGTDGNHWTLEARFDTLAEKLQRAGYRTAGFSNNVWTNDVSGLKQGFDHFEELWHDQPTRGGKIAHDDPATDMGAARTNARILSFVDGVEARRPFFVFVNYFEPHLPTARVDGPALAILGSLYDGEIAYLDAKLGELLAALRERRRLDDTVVVVTSDHGEHLGEHHLLEHKFSIYEPLLRVPLIVRAPGRVAAGRRIATPVSASDLFGTILRLADAGKGAARELPVRDLPGAAPVPVFSELEFPRIFLEVMRREFPGWDTSRFARSLTAVRRGSHKLISGSDGSVVLFDLATDPAEEKNLAASLPAVTAELQELVRQFSGTAPVAKP